MPTKKNLILFISLLILIISGCTQKEETKQTKETAETGISQGEGEYNLPYVLPNKDSIKTVLDRVLSYFNNNTEYKVIDGKTGAGISDFSKLNQNADLATGENNDVLSLWSYTMGVSYSGMLKVTEATGDKKFEQYDIKNIDFYLDNLPYFKGSIPHSANREIGTMRFFIQTR